MRFFYCMDQYESWSQLRSCPIFWVTLIQEIIQLQEINIKWGVDVLFLRNENYLALKSEYTEGDIGSMELVAENTCDTLSWEPYISKTMCWLLRFWIRITTPGIGLQSWRPTVTPSPAINHMDKFNYPAVCDKTPPSVYFYCRIPYCGSLLFLYVVNSQCIILKLDFDWILSQFPSWVLFKLLILN